MPHGSAPEVIKSGKIQKSKIPSQHFLDNTLRMMHANFWKNHTIFWFRISKMCKKFNFEKISIQVRKCNFLLNFDQKVMKVLRLLRNLYIFMQRMIICLTFSKIIFFYHFYKFYGDSFTFFAKNPLYYNWEILLFGRMFSRYLASLKRKYLCNR